MNGRRGWAPGAAGWSLVLCAFFLMPAPARAQQECGSAAMAAEQVALTVAGPAFNAAFGGWGDLISAGLGVEFTEAPADIWERCWREAQEEDEEDDGYYDPYGLLEEDDDDDGWSWGDPHLVTFDGLAYDFHGAGDYVLMEHASSDSVIQSRFVRASDTRYSAQYALAVSVGDRTVVLYEEKTAGFEPIVLDGRQIPFQAGGWYEDEDLRIQRIRHWTFVRFANGLSIATSSGATNRIHLPSAWGGEVRGLLGDDDGDPANDVVRRDGTAVDPGDADTLYGAFLDDWFVDPEDSLFIEPFDVAARGPIRPGAVPTLAELPEDAVSEARELCLNVGLRPGLGLEACMFDVSLTGDDAWATADGALSGHVLTPSSVMPQVTRMFELGDELVNESLEAVGVAHEIQIPEAADGTTRILEAADSCDAVLPAAVAVVIDGRARTQRSLGCDTSLELPRIAHSLLVTDPSGGTADYAFSVLERAIDGLVDAGSLEFDVPITIPMAANGQQWRWSLQDGTATDMFIQRAELERADSATDSVCGARWSLLDADDQSLASGSLCIDAPRIDASGATTFVVDIPPGVRASFLPGITGASDVIAVDLADRVRFDGVLESPGQIDTYVLRVESNTQLLLMNEAGGNDCGVVWSVVEGDTEVFRGASCFDTDPIRLSAGGDVRIVVDAGSDPGAYGLDIVRVPDARSDVLEFGEAQDASIAVPGDKVLLAFDAEVGDELVLADTIGGNSNCGIVWRILGPFEPGGVEDKVFEGATCFDTDPIRLRRAGHYLLEVDGKRSETGAVSVTAFEVPEPRVAPLRFAEEVDASIETPGARVQLTFDARAGDAITLSEPANGNDDCGIVWRILGPGGDEDQVFQGPVCFDTAAIELPRSGEYVLEVDAQRARTGRVGVLAERR
ncbi:MAG: VWD domain-containing protein [Woeseiaceae bacterium]|nr:VWD domain-containing protein [Woeseiaceae bacterium]